MLIIKEYYLHMIRPFYNLKLIKVFMGIRGAGKTLLFETIRKELLDNGFSAVDIIFMNFEDLRLSVFRTSESLHHEILRRAGGRERKIHIFLDEIQLVDKWEECVNSLRVVLDSDIYITGSNADLLSGELATLLNGRYVKFEIYPFSFKEFLLSYPSSLSDTRSLFLKYVEFGGMPELIDAGLRIIEVRSIYRVYLKR